MRLVDAINSFLADARLLSRSEHAGGGAAAKSTTRAASRRSQLLRRGLVSSRMVRLIRQLGFSGAVIAVLAAGVLGLSAPYARAADSASLPLGPSTEVSLPSNAFFGPFRFPRSHTFGTLSAVACPPGGPCVAVGGYSTDEGGGEEAMVVTESGEGWTQATEIPPPSHPTFIDAQLLTVACPATGECVALGTYLDGSGSRQTMAVSESGGVWGRAIEIPEATLRSLACRAPGSCVAVGTGPDGSQLVGVIQSVGVWGSPQAIALPANDAPEYVVELSDTACQASGPCVTVGSYTTTSHHQRGLGIVESNGRWTASEIVATPGSEVDTRFYSVACPASGPCVADGLGEVALGVAELDGNWGMATPIMPAPNPAAKLLALYGTACAGSSGQCFAVGYDERSSTQSLPVVAGASGGVWGQAGELAPPPTAGPGASAQLRSVACTASDSCVAIGEYDDVSGSHAMAVNETHGVWGPASEISPPPGNADRSSSSHASLALLACPGTGLCAALGRYGDTAGDVRLMAAGMAPRPLRASEPSGCRPAGSSAVHVRRNGRGLVRVSCGGSDASSGRVKLTVRMPSKKRHPRIRVLASARFSSGAEATVAIGLRLSAFGRALLKHARGRLSATLTVVRTSPMPTQIHSRGVRLSRVR